MKVGSLIHLGQVKLVMVHIKRSQLATVSNEVRVNDKNHVHSHSMHKL